VEGEEVSLMDWSNVRDPCSLVNSLSDFLTKVFGEELLREEAKKLDLYAPKGRPESLEYLRPIGVHRAAKWYKLLGKLKEHNYSFDLKFSTEIEEFMNLTLFAYSFDTLIRCNVLSLDNAIVRGRLHDKDGFEPLLYEALVASNYASNKFDVLMPDLLGEGRIDVYARKGSVEACCECKRLRRKEQYVDLAIKIMSELHERRLSLMVDMELLKRPKSIEGLVKLAERAVEEGRPLKSEEARVQVQSLPELVEDAYEVSVPRPETVEYLVSAAYMGIFNGTLKVKEPKIVVIRDLNKPRDLERQLKDRLREAAGQLSSISGHHKLIYVDVSEVVGRPVLQLPEMMRLSQGPEILASHLEGKCREWLEAHPNVDAVVLTLPKLYIDEFGNPYAINVENRAVAAYVAPGWAMTVRVIPMPQGAPPEVLVNLGVEMSKRGNYPLAISYFKRALEMNPNLKEAYNDLGRALNDLGRPDEALKYLEAALKLEPNYVSALINRGIALAKLGRYTEALKDLDKALSLDPTDEKAWYNKALICYMMSQRGEPINVS
jgi:tetratricopeptide (TPR) repeat protein